VLTRELTVFVRPGCHLCTDMLQALECLKSELDFRYCVQDVDEVAALAARYGDRVPVLVANETELCWYFLDTDRLREYLSSA
jgi:glutaredoxin